MSIGFERISMFVAVRNHPSFRRSLINGRYKHTSTKLFDKILIANRGEIAIRVMKTCKKLGIKTVAIHSEADGDSLFVKCADEAVCVGPAPSVQSYLNMDAILDACLSTKSQAVHPGYGFLSEKYTFAELLQSNNINFIGPSREALKLMGDKIESKRFATSVNVNIVPGYDGVVENAKQAISIANQIGYPIMIKAAGGGGGKGMRIAYDDAQVEEGFHLCVAEATSSFNDDRILIEKYIEEPRHIEFQIVGDHHGNVVHLNERECSIQRRNQKILEEAPSFALSNQLRQTIGAQAVHLSKCANYYSAGTVEFMLDKHKKFYFLEMNTRLQVEHPITEAITGIDIVEQMIRVAAGEKLPITQEDVKIKGWAIENRINSENPYKNLGIPSIGRIIKYSEPSGYLKNVRVDSGIREGSEISMFYDSLIAKLICYGKDRNEALKLSRTALDHFAISGVKHNIALLRDIMDDEDFVAGDFTTNYLKLKYPNGFKGRAINNAESLNVIAAVIFSYLKYQRRFYYRNQCPSPTSDKIFLQQVKDKLLYVKLKEHKSFPVRFTSITNFDNFSLSIGSNLCSFMITSSNPYYTEANINEVLVIFQKVSKENNIYGVQLYGTIFEAAVFSEKEFSLYENVPRKIVDDLANIIVTPMQGIVRNVYVTQGQVVQSGDVIAVVEAMKMHNSILSEKGGKIKSVNVQEGGKVIEGDIIVEFE